MFVACSSSDDTDHAAEIAKLEQWIVGQWSPKEVYPNHYEVIVFTADKQYIFADKYKDDDAYVFERGTYYITYEKNKLSQYSIYTVVDGVDYKMNFRMDSPDVMYFGDDTPQKRDNTDYTFIEKQKQAKL